MENAFKKNIPQVILNTLSQHPSQESWNHQSRYSEEHSGDSQDFI